MVKHRDWTYKTVSCCNGCSNDCTHALSCGENPLWIAKVMGHRDTDMIIRVYGKYIENAGNHEDGAKFDGIYKGIMSKEK